MIRVLMGFFILVAVVTVLAVQEPEPKITEQAAVEKLEQSVSRLNEATQMFERAVNDGS